MKVTDEELVERAQKEDAWAMGELVNRYQEKAYAVAYRFCSYDKEEARDITQESFLKAFRHIKKFRKDASFYTWLYRIIVNTCLDWKRSRKKWKPFFVWTGPEREGRPDPTRRIEETAHADEGSNPMQALQSKSLKKDIQHALKRLPEKQRMVFQLKVFNGMTIREIAQIMGSAEGTIKSHLFRATHFLRAALEEWVKP